MLDDHPMMLLTLGSVIESSFSTVKIFKAQTTTNALTILADQTADLIILDLGLPDCPAQLASGS